MNHLGVLSGQSERKAIDETAGSPVEILTEYIENIAKP
jgi:hypothetical protein